MFDNPQILLIAFVIGTIPALLWLFFWIREEETRPEPKGALAIVFIMGMLGVACVLPIQKIIQVYVNDDIIRLIGWASVEEIAKYLAVFVIFYKTSKMDEPLDFPIYLVTAGLGFAALENALFLVKPLYLGETTVGLLTTNLRFLGSTLLHAVSSGILGISLGISFHMGKLSKIWHALVGFIFAIALHSIFNFFIIRNGGRRFLKVFAFLWVVSAVVILLFEKVRRMS